MHLDTDELAYRMSIKPITAGELAERVGISRQSMYNIVKGRSNPRPGTLTRICAELGCTAETLLVRGAGLYTEHDRFAHMMVSRYRRELDGYDVEAAALDYIHSWLAEQYGELTAEQYREAKDVANREGERFAFDLKRLFECLECLFISEDTRLLAAEEAFNAFFETLPDTIEPYVGLDPFDGENA